MAKQRLDEDSLMKIIDVYYEHGGNFENAAKALKTTVKSFKHKLKIAEKRLGTQVNKVQDGRVAKLVTKKMPLPSKGCIRRYILTSAQNNTYLHPGFDNLVAYAEYLDGIQRAKCQLVVGTYTYNVSAYKRGSVKRGKDKAEEELWYDPRIEPYVIDESTELAPMLIWCGEQNILPTSKLPLTGFADYNGTKSNIVPHAQMAMESVPTMAGEYSKFNYATGTITQRNYIQKRVGILAEQRHTYAALIVEVDHNGNWWARHLMIDDNHDITDVGPRGEQGVRITNGKVKKERVVDLIYWGDVHAYEIGKWVRDMCWGRNGMLDTLRPKYQCMGDVLSVGSRGHHEINNFHSTFSKMVGGTDSVRDEVQQASNLVKSAHRRWCKTVIVGSNHDDHLTRWLNEADFRKDPLNAKYFCHLQYNLLDALENGENEFNVMEFAMREAGVPKSVEFLSKNSSFIVAGVENSLHGDLGPNGARGSTANLQQLGRAINKGHDHKATIRWRVFSAGSCATKFSYSKGPQSKSVSHIVNYKNGSRAIITMRFNKWRA